MLSIIHTADWHLGKKLEGRSRHNEQVEVLEEIITHINEKNPQLVIIAGDIYDSVNPPAESEKLFYDTLKKIYDKNRIIVIISGNHDNSVRLSSTQQLAEEYNVLFFEDPNKLFELKKYSNYEIINSDLGSVLIKLNDKEFIINTLPFPTQVNLNTDFDKFDSYSKHMSSLLTNNFNKKDIIEINIAHIYLSSSKVNGEERLGGAQSINIKDLPKVNYTALGHIHKPQVFKDYNTAYSGSILEYRSSEAQFKKCILHITIDNNNTNIKKLELSKPKPIIQGEFYKFDDLINFLKENDNKYVYATINLKENLSQQQRDELNSYENLISIITLFEDIKKGDSSYIDQNKSINTYFSEAYEIKNNIKPNKEIIDLFNELLSEVENETK